MTSSSDEGEIVERAGDLKATSLSHADRNGVDRKDRQRNRNSSPDIDSTSKHNNSSRRSRSPRGFKRSRDDRDRLPPRARDQDARHDRGASDDHRRDDYKRSRVAYDDLDRPASRTANQGYDWRSRRDRERDRSRERDRYHRERDRYSERSPRPRSPSPHQYRRGDKRGGDRFVREGFSDRPDSRTLRYDDGDVSTRGNNSAARKAFAGDRNQALENDAKTHKGTTQNDGSGPAAISREVSMPDEPEVDYDEAEAFDEEAEIERRRKRRGELLAKSSSATPLLLHAVGAATSKAQALSPASLQSDTPLQSQHSDSKASQSPGSNFPSPRSPMSHDAPSPGGIDPFDDKDLMNSHGAVKANDEDGPSAADYDPTVDMVEDERRHELRHGQVVIHGEPEPVAVLEQNPTIDVPSAPPQKPSAGEGDDDDDFDMFAENFDEDKYASKAQANDTAASAEANDAVEAADKGGILEGDDKDGYYKIRIGEILKGRYQIQATLGRGMFSGVARAVDITTKQLVAIKMMRNNDALRKGGYTEIAILQKLNEADPENRKHIVKFEHSFDHRGHLCLAFENLSMNLREVLRKFGNNVGINLKATKAYAYQIFVALAHMRKCSIIHADLKPDNILVNENRNILKICDLGTAIDRSDAATAHTEITPYLVSRFYRAPEIILGMPYDYGVDMWSIGCTLYELYTGKILFTGDSNNQMLKTIMEIRGRITPKLYKRGQLSSVHFDDQGQFISIERDKVLGKTALRPLNIVKPTRDLRTRLLAASSGMNDAESRELNHFIDLLDHCLALNPDKRLKPADALKHPFFVARSGVPRR
ncbi:CMGC/DYRK/PRP4 protein kinase [Trichoderma gamsii]|uniref:non-specific serine/threonine protein kinase n=1 Tax=Trichoderma gamsii TaxID=398673 RepID=A0A2P4ZN50_9HYPO|nr:CMGC/DYRK/PRP4 protein kinase [Trichoderma gamsii]PON25727.1 CMGC/DYRK/PRP4 protein kinase [Trichoderma gamsii]